MTITYTNDVSKVRLLGFSRLLGRWKGGIYKLLYREILIYCTCYGLISVLYRLVLTGKWRRTFEQMVFYFSNFEGLIPVTFILGFYVTFVGQRWWNQYVNIPWPDKIVTYLAAHIRGNNFEARLLRRTIIRYLILSEVILFQSISPPIKKRFPTHEHIVESGLMTSHELKMFTELCSPHHKYWVPCHWAALLLGRARQAGLITDEYSFNVILTLVNDWKMAVGMLYSYDWISIPLVYTQVSTISVYIFFLTSLVSRQFIDPAAAKEILGGVSPMHIIDIYVPGFTILQLFFYLGLLKVAEQMINPFGEDDDDFEVNWIIDRNLQVGLLAIDEMYDQLPRIEKDRFWGDPETVLPYTKATMRYHTEETWMGSVATLDVDRATAHFVHMETIAELEPDDAEASRRNSEVESGGDNRGSVYGSGAGRFGIGSRSGSRNQVDSDGEGSASPTRPSYDTRKISDIDSRSRGGGRTGSVSGEAEDNMSLSSSLSSSTRRRRRFMSKRTSGPTNRSSVLKDVHDKERLLKPLSIERLDRPDYSPGVQRRPRPRIFASSILHPRRPKSTHQLTSVGKDQTNRMSPALYTSSQRNISKGTRNSSRSQRNISVPSANMPTPSGSPPIVPFDQPPSILLKRNSVQLGSQVQTQLGSSDRLSTEATLDCHHGETSKDPPCRPIGFGEGIVLPSSHLSEIGEGAGLIPSQPSVPTNGEKSVAQGTPHHSVGSPEAKRSGSQETDKYVKAWIQDSKNDFPTVLPLLRNAASNANLPTYISTDTVMTNTNKMKMTTCTGYGGIGGTVVTTTPAPHFTNTGAIKSGEQSDPAKSGIDSVLNVATPSATFDPIGSSSAVAFGYDSSTCHLPDYHIVEASLIAEPRSIFCAGIQSTGHHSPSSQALEITHSSKHADPLSPPHRNYSPAKSMTSAVGVHSIPNWSGELPMEVMPTVFEASNIAEAEHVAVAPDKGVEMDEGLPEKFVVFDPEVVMVEYPNRTWPEEEETSFLNTPQEEGVKVETTTEQEAMSGVNFLKPLVEETPPSGEEHTSLNINTQ